MSGTWKRLPICGGTEVFFWVHGFAFQFLSTAFIDVRGVNRPCPWQCTSPPHPSGRQGQVAFAGSCQLVLPILQVMPTGSYLLSRSHVAAVSMALGFSYYPSPSPVLWGPPCTVAGCTLKHSLLFWTWYSLIAVVFGQELACMCCPGDVAEQARFCLRVDLTVCVVGTDILQPALAACAGRLTVQLTDISSAWTPSTCSYLPSSHPAHVSSPF